jgi:hypothetical protein
LCLSRNMVIIHTVFGPGRMRGYCTAAAMGSW